MTYIKAKYHGSARAYTFKTEDEVLAGDTVITDNGKKLEVVSDTVDMGWIETYGEDRIVEVKRYEEPKENPILKDFMKKSRM